jgi:hypothetical protein
MDQRLRRPAALTVNGEQAERFPAFGEATDRLPNQLLREAVALLLVQQRSDR